MLLEALSLPCLETALSGQTYNSLGSVLLQKMLPNVPMSLPGSGAILHTEPRCGNNVSVCPSIPCAHSPQVADLAVCPVSLPSALSGC